MEKAKEVLKKIGLSKEDIEKLMSTDENVTKDVVVEDIVTGITTNFKEVFDNDGTFDDVRKQTQKAVLTSRDKKMMAAFREAGIEITDEEYNSFEEKGRSDELARAIAKKAQEKVKASGSDKNAQEEIERLNKEVLALKDEKKKIEEEIIPGLKTESEKKISEYKRNLLLKELYASETKGKLVADENSFYPAFEVNLNNQYDIELENDKPVLYQKGTKNKAFKDNKPLELTDVIRDLTKDWVKKSDNPDPKKKPEPGKGDTEITTVGSKAFKEELERKKALLGKKD